MIYTTRRAAIKALNSGHYGPPGGWLRKVHKVARFWSNKSKAYRYVITMLPALGKAR